MGSKMKVLKDLLPKFMPRLFKRMEKFNQGKIIYTEQEKLQAVKKWSESQKYFDSEFIDSLEEYLMDHNSLTYEQEKGLDNIIEGFKVNLERYL